MAASSSNAAPKRARQPKTAAEPSPAEVVAQLRAAHDTLGEAIERAEELADRAGRLLNDLEESNPEFADPTAIVGTRQEVAARLGLETATVDAWFRRASPPPGERGRYDVMAITRWAIAGKGIGDGR